MNFNFHPEAEIEFNEAIDYYEKIETGLGYDFAIEVYNTIQFSVQYPFQKRGQLLMETSDGH